MNVKFHTRDSPTGLPVEVQMKLLQFYLGKFPFECRRGYTEIGQGANDHIAADAGEAIQVKNAHPGLPTLKFGWRKLLVLQFRLAWPDLKRR